MTRAARRKRRSDSSYLNFFLFVFASLQQKQRVKDFKSIIIKYLESLVQTQQQVHFKTGWFDENVFLFCIIAHVDLNIKINDVANR